MAMTPWARWSASPGKVSGPSRAWAARRVVSVVPAASTTASAAIRTGRPVRG
ncbi:hypothetical protein ACIRBX_26480 [Kitasatospora sp. NPDC096147]|uniref:hypothetical protein n=1 Tax=Kitasatospora sp. NPDC096147 TaxID=3364093 RepID=UPI003806DC62